MAEDAVEADFGARNGVLKEVRLKIEVSLPPQNAPGTDRVHAGLGEDKVQFLLCHKLGSAREFHESLGYSIGENQLHRPARRFTSSQLVYRTAAKPASARAS